MRDDPSAEGPMALWSQVEAVPGAVDVLSSLRPRWRLALATNAAASDETQIRTALERVDLDRLIEKIFCFRGVGFKKPSPEFFEYVLKTLNVDVNRVIVVGDTFDVDVVGANRMGIRAIWLNQRTDEICIGPLHRTIRNLIELPRVLSDFVC